MNFWHRIYFIESTWKRRVFVSVLIIPTLLVYPFVDAVKGWRNSLRGAAQFWKKR